MRIRLKPLRDQVMVITGATSGIGLALARRAARRGARLVLVGRNDDSLAALVAELQAAGGEALAVTADVGNEADVQRVADAAVDRFGGFDTWVNNAGVSVYGRLQDTPVADQRRLFDTNYWGAVQGSLVATGHLARHGGALINVGSVLGERAVPLQGAYSASKHALKGFTDALRMELEEAGAPVAVTLIKPSSIDTPYPERARNLLDQEPRVPAPLYSAELVADTILHAAEHPLRDMVVGGSGRMLVLMGSLAPRLTDRLMEGRMGRAQRRGTPARPRPDALYSPVADGRVQGDQGRVVFKRSLYTAAARRPVVAAAALLGAGWLVWTMAGAVRRRR